MLGAGLALSPQAVRAVRGYAAPSLDLSFMNGVMPPGVTFTRASTADYTDVDGVSRTAEINQPRLTASGLMVFDAATAGAAEIATIPTVSPWFTAGNIGTWLVEFGLGGALAADRCAFEVFNNGAKNNRYQMFVQITTGNLLARSGAADGTTNDVTVAAASVGSDVVKAALAYSGTSASATANGAAVAASAAYKTNTGLDRVTLGRNRNDIGFLNGHLRRLRYWPARLDDATLRALTA